MKEKNIFPFLLPLLFIGCCMIVKPVRSQKFSIKVNFQAASSTDSLLYFGQPRPGDTPVIFAPGIISRVNRHEFGCTISNDGTAFYFGVDHEGKSMICYTTLSENGWSPQKRIFESVDFSYNDPMLSFNGRRLYFISNQSAEGNKEKTNYDIWYSVLGQEQRSAPVNIGPPVNTPRNEYFNSFTESGTLYFSRESEDPDAPSYAYDIYRSELKNGKYLPPEILPETINTTRYEADIFIAPDESYMIFCSIRKGGFGLGDLYISFKDEKGNWLPAKNMGDSINTSEHELCPFVTRDNRYLFFTREGDIYWVSTSLLYKFR